MENVCGNRLAELRSERNLTQDQIAEIAGVSRVSYTRYENGTRIPKAVPLLKMAEYFGVDPKYITGEAERRRETQTDDDDKMRHDMLYGQLTGSERALAEQYMRFLLAQREK